MKYDRLKLLEMAKAKLAEAKAGHENKELQDKYHAALKEAKAKAIDAITLHLKNVRRWKPDGTEAFPAFPRTQMPNRPWTDNTNQIHRLEVLIRQFTASAEDVIEVRPRTGSFDEFYELFR